MRVDFVVESEVVDLEDIILKVGREPDKSKRKGDLINAAGSRKWDFNRVTYKVAKELTSDRLEIKMVELMNSLPSFFSELEAYKYFDVVIEEKSLAGDFRLANSTIERMRKLDIQIEIDVTRY